MFDGIKDTAVSKVVSRMKQKLTYDKELRRKTQSIMYKVKQ